MAISRKDYDVDLDGAFVLVEGGFEQTSCPRFGISSRRCGPAMNNLLMRWRPERSVWPP